MTLPQKRVCLLSTVLYFGLTFPGLNFVAGGMAGCFATLAAHPLDVLRTRFVAQTSVESKVRYCTSWKLLLEVWTKY